MHNKQPACQRLKSLVQCVTTFLLLGITALSASAADSWKEEVLLAFAMQKYYTETDTSAGYNKALFKSETGGISFSMSDVAATPSEAKGMKYFNDYLAQSYNGLSQAERETIAAQIANMEQWFVQAGANGMNATAESKAAFMLGGKGFDTYIQTGDGLDTILHSDGQGCIAIEGQQAGGLGLNMAGAVDGLIATKSIATCAHSIRARGQFCLYSRPAHCRRPPTVIRAPHTATLQGVHHA